MKVSETLANPYNRCLFSLGGCCQPGAQLWNQPPPCRLLQVFTDPQNILKYLQHSILCHCNHYHLMLSQWPGYHHIALNTITSKSLLQSPPTPSHVHLCKQLRGNRMSQSFGEAKAVLREATQNMPSLWLPLTLLHTLFPECDYMHCFAQWSDGCVLALLH